MPSVPMVASNTGRLFLSCLHAGIAVTSSADSIDGSNCAVSLDAPRQLSSKDSQVNLPNHQRHVVQVVAATMACVSITASLLALYWFCLMRYSFRRNLVVLLILSDVFKNFCYLMYGGVSLGRGEVMSADVFCQASGYMLQTGIEACDFAVLILSLHMTLQIFPLPNTILGYDGLYNVRYWVYATWFCLPNITASLAFINDSAAYQVQGAWCWLPVRPFWYRLALAWIPRYIITIAILCFAITIYLYVGKELRIFGLRRVRTSSLDAASSLATTSIGLGNDTRAYGPSTSRSYGITLEGATALEVPVTETSVKHQLTPDARRLPLPAWNSPFYGQVARADRGSQSAANTRRGSRQVAFDLTEEPVSPLQQASGLVRPVLTHLRSDIPSCLSVTGTTTISGNPASLSALEEARTNVSVTASFAVEAAQLARRRAITRQVGSLFIYPVAYIVFWIVPFIAHCMNYSDYYAANPIFGLVLMTSWCTTTLGLVDAVIFSWRERPWRHIPGSDGTFLGSLCFWRFFKADLSRKRRVASTQQYDEKRRESAASAVLSFLGALTWRRLSSGAGTHAASDSLQIYKQRKHQGAADCPHGTAASHPQTPGSRNWFDNIVEPDELDLRTRRPTWSGWDGR